MKFLLVIDLIMNTICSMHTYFDLISLPLSYLNFPHLSFFVQAWLFIQQLRYVLYAIYFAKFWKRISDCVYIDFAHGLCSIGAIHIPKMFEGGEHSFWATPILLWEN